MARLFLDWPVMRQLRTGDFLGRGPAVQSQRTRDWTARTKTADRVVKSVCPYCAVGCGQRIYVKNERIVQIEGDPDSPVSRGRLCPKGSASEQLVNSPQRATKQPGPQPQPAHVEAGPLPATVRDRLGEPGPRRRDRHDRRPGHRDAAPDLAGPRR